MDNVARKRSSLKHENIFPEGMTLEQFVEMNKNKTIKWDQKVIIEEEDNTEEQPKEVKEVNIFLIQQLKIEQVSDNLKKLSIDGRRSSRYFFLNQNYNRNYH
jgi:ABC-type cobalamin/Fe3+-siderophores transport system ATPase subunit